MFQTATIFFLFFTQFAFAAEPAPRPSGCFSPINEPTIHDIITPNPAYNETIQSLHQMHELIWSHRDLIDPRLVYFRMLGESRGDPNAENPSSHAFGLFQFLGDHRTRVKRLMAQHPKESKRLIQVRYYLDQYVHQAAAAADAGVGCRLSPKNKSMMTKPWAQYTNLERVTFLGTNNCSRSGKNTELNRCTTRGQYRDIACPFANRLMRQQPTLPLCPTPFPRGRAHGQLLPHTPRANSH